MTGGQEMAAGGGGGGTQPPAQAGMEDPQEKDTDGQAMGGWGRQDAGRGPQPLPLCKGWT